MVPAYRPSKLINSAWRFGRGRAGPALIIQLISGCIGLVSPGLSQDLGYSMILGLSLLEGYWKEYGAPQRNPQRQALPANPGQVSSPDASRHLLSVLPGPALGWPVLVAAQEGGSQGCWL